jgi:hypothetical protein
MKDRIAAFCCLLVLQSSVVSAGPTSNVGPLRRASLEKPTLTPRSDSRAIKRADRDQAVPDPAPDTRSWSERHPVWTGALVGFSAGFLLTYAVAASDDHHNQLLTPVDPGGPALVWGGLGAGIGALAGWGIGRSRHDGYHDRATAPAR